MNKQDLLTLFARCHRDSVLFAVAQEAASRLHASSTAVIVVDGDPLPREHWLDIYTFRLKLVKERNEHIPGLEETVQAFAESQGRLGGGYAKSESGLIYFWTDGAGNLAGCVLLNKRTV